MKVKQLYVNIVFPFLENIYLLAMNLVPFLYKKFGTLSDKINGTDFYQDIGTDKLNLNRNHSEKYEASKTFELRRIFNYLSLTPSDSIIDLGCGKGIVICFLTRNYSLKKICGIDLAGQLIEIAKLNLLKFKSNNEVEILKFDSTELKGKFDEYNVIYMYNPFPEPVVKIVIQDILDSYRRNPRKLTIVYNNPQHAKVIADTNRFTMVKEFKFITSTIKTFVFVINE